MRKAIRGLNSFLVSMHPLRFVLFGYIAYITIGWILLSLPLVKRGTGVTALDGLFISTSAVSTTGLVTTSISQSYTFIGQLIILILIQLGGLGYMTLSSFVILSGKRQLSDTRSEVAQVVFSLPQ